MAYVYDEDLEFIKNCTSDQLEDLVYCITHGKNGSLRLTESLTLSDEYKKFYPDHHKYWKLIAEEIQCFGGNTFANLFRGGGVKYKSILIDVCKRLKVNYNKNQSTEVIEMNMFMKILEDSFEQMSSEDIKKVLEDLDIETSSYVGFTPQIAMFALQSAIKLGKFKSYKIAVIVANSVYKKLFGRGLKFVTNHRLTKSISILAGPIGVVINILWTAFDIAGPAYRVTVPAVTQIAFMRIMYKQKLRESIV